MTLLCIALKAYPTLEDFFKGDRERGEYKKIQNGVLETPFLTDPV